MVSLRRFILSVFILFFISLPLSASTDHSHIFSNISAAPEISFVSLLRGIIGMLFLIFIAWLFSTNRKAINWRTVFVGLLIQVVLAVGVLYLPAVQWLFEFIGRFFVSILDFTKEGSVFLFGSLMDIKGVGYIFALQILPTIIFFSALTSVLFYLGIIQKLVLIFAKGFSKILSLSGAESLAVIGNIFLGMVETPLMVKAYLDRMTKSEIFMVMTGGMATIAGGALAAYVGFLGGDDPVAQLVIAKHLLAASVMAAPGAVVVAKILVPHTEAIVSDAVVVERSIVGANILDAISNGTIQGLKLALNIGGMLIVFIAFMAMINAFLVNIIGDYTGLNSWVSDFTTSRYNSFNLQFILGTLLSPFMWVIGVSADDIWYVGQVLGEKIILNEFIGYSSLAVMKAEGLLLHPKSIYMAIYMLCGFANFGSVGIQIGGIGALAPSQKKCLSEFGFLALVAGTITSCLSATIVGMFL